MHHGEEQIVALKSEAYNIKHAHTGIPRIERLNRQTRDFHGDGRIGLLFEGEFHTLAKEGDGGPSWNILILSKHKLAKTNLKISCAGATLTHSRGDGRKHHQGEEFTHFGEGDRVVACVRLGKQWMRVYLIPDIQCSAIKMQWIL